MAVEHVHRAVFIDDLCLQVSAWRYICDKCGSKATFPDHPMPEGRSEFEAGEKGWHLSYIDEESVTCPSCRARPTPSQEGEQHG